VEVVQRMSDEPLRECKSCGGELRKVLFPPAVVYKGSGFYVTDYKNAGRSSESSSGSDSAKSSENGKSSESAKSSDSSSSSDSSKPAETKSESKSETKSST
jgi:predicted nucleic acid-binding Zn ribbon protein